MEIREPVMKRLPPGDRWVEIKGDQQRVYPSLTAAVEYMFQKYIVRQEADPEPEIQTFSIYGDM